MKGGVGKTTTALHLAAGLAARGKRVLLVDADPQGSLAYLLGIRPARSIEDLLLLARTADDVITRQVRPGLDLIAATPSAFALEEKLANVPDRELRLRHALEPLEDVDVAVLDCSPAMSVLSYNALLCAQELVIPVAMDPLAIVGATRTLLGVQQIAALWPGHPLRPMAVLPVAVNPATHAARAAMAALERDASMAPLLVRPGIRQCLDLTYAAAARQTIWEYAPRSRAAADYAAFVDHVQAWETRPEAYTRELNQKEAQADVRDRDHGAAGGGDHLGAPVHDAIGLHAG
jgi:chromosome partitioning protein